MSMTKKHFEWAADYLAASQRTAEERHAMRCFAMALFTEFGAHFDAARFTKAVIDRRVRPAPVDDVMVRNEGSIFLVEGRTEVARKWMRDHLPAEAQVFGRAVVVEHRYIEEIVTWMRESGLRVQS